jgi:hypothetical protein
VVLPSVLPSSVREELLARGVELTSEADTALDRFLAHFLLSSMVSSSYKFYFGTGQARVELLDLTVSRPHVVEGVSSTVTAAARLYAATATYQPKRTITKHHSIKKKKWYGRTKEHHWTTEEVDRGYTAVEYEQLQNLLISKLNEKAPQP